MSVSEWTQRAVAWSNEHPPPPGAPAGSRVPRSPTEHAAWARWSADLHQAGLGVLHWPVEWGGAGADAAETRAVSRVLAQAGSPLPLNDIGITLVGPSIMRFGTPEQRAAHLPTIASGSTVWTQLFSEPASGSDLASLQTTAVPSGDGWAVNGEKIWNTYAHVADWGYLLARTGAPGERHRGLTMFLVRMDTPGITARPIRKLMGSADFAGVTLENVRLPANAVLGEPGEGWAVTMATLSEERRVVGRFVVGLESELIRMLRILDSLGAAASDSLRLRMGELAAEVDALLRVVESNADLPGSDSLSKIAYSDLNQRLHQVAIELAAAHPEAVPDAWALRWSDNYRNSPSYTIAGGANEVLRNVLAKRVLSASSVSANPSNVTAEPGDVPTGPAWAATSTLRELDRSHETATAVMIDTRFSNRGTIVGRVWGDPAGGILALTPQGSLAFAEAADARLTPEPLDCLGGVVRVEIDVRHLRSLVATRHQADDHRARVAFALAAAAVAGAANATARTLEYVQNRHQFGQTLWSLQAVQHRVVDMHLATVLGEALVARAASAWQGDEPAAAESSWLAKLFASRTAWVVEQAIQLHGAIGLTEDHGLQHPLSDAQRARLLLGGDEAAAHEIIRGRPALVIDGLHDWSTIRTPADGTTA
ncbi:MAG: acyl-CoA dehydrogenase [Frankiales bacterium]|nr:acyl-CoA dehydrogenase [Frankiales bacterium]